MNIEFPPVYPITDTKISGLPVIEQVRAFIAGGARLFQVREKGLNSRDLFYASAEAVKVAHEHGVKVIINDRADIALLAGADGVHLGQQDLAPEHARRLLGPRAIIGYSTHSIEQTERAADMPVDYVAFGPVFNTSTKSDHEPIVGLELLANIKAIVGGIPLVAIGGIDRNRLSQVLRSGADSAAVISSVLTAPSGIEAELDRMFQAADMLL